MSACATVFAQTFFHGSKADLKPGDVIAPGYASNYPGRGEAAYVYLTATLDAAIWGAELAQGTAPGRIYVVEPMGAYEDDPELTNRKFEGNPTKSYRTSEGLRVIGEVVNWSGHAPAQIQAMKDNIARLS